MHLSIERQYQEIPKDAFLSYRRKRAARRRSTIRRETALLLPLSRKIIYWSIKMTHGGIRWHVSVHGWPLILILVSIRSSNVAFHGSFISAPFPPTDGECVSIGIGYRTTNASFANDNHPRRSLRSRSDLSRAATNYYPSLNPGSPSVNAALRRAKPTRWGITPGKRTMHGDTIGFEAAVTGRRADISARCAKNASRGMRVRARARARRVDW